jgi:hypothetical protein
MPSYNELNKMSPEMFLNPDNFKTPNDEMRGEEYACKQYEKGLRIANESLEVGVSVGGTWFAIGKNGSQFQSYEGIGYHPCTSDLLKGFLDGSAQFVIVRLTDKGYTQTCIKPAMN